MQNRVQQVDPLDILRDFSLQEKQIKQKDNYIYFNQVKFPLKQSTCWKAVASGKEYSLGTIWLFLEQKKQNLSFKDYSSKAQQFGVDIVTKIDQDDVYNYFKNQDFQTQSYNLELKQKLLEKNKREKHQLPGDLINKKIKTDEKNQELTQQEEFQYNMMKEILKVENPINSKTRILRDTTYNRKFGHLLNYFNVFDQRQENSASQIHVDLPNCILGRILKRNRKPVIVVPANSMEGNVCLKNFSQLFELGIYEDPKRSKLKVYIEGKIQITKKINNMDIKFEIIDNIGQIKLNNEWDRIVGIFLQGSKYQYNQWPNSQSPDFFQNKRAYYVHYQNQQPNDFIKSVNCKLLPINKDNRQGDKDAKNEFWKDLTNFLMKPL
ncbi:hypothetical protein PPERSA_12668 [Pseudocohnilembus persalinus]|uniref:Uncharacterized protein n=1 Tax=Pseudocohnilembus persalinus TaxID=266149 RepID=A0A0V0QME5_PSEPJ|nr:hypothetical protein PPERSA_12668 [Pseudocohnilembus persalinus]|eukprot:KRX03389.1 hypothetical protein PPERSA_12668 [Pseudocohnilembus persalinus]